MKPIFVVLLILFSSFYGFSQTKPLKPGNENYKLKQDSLFKNFGNPGTIVIKGKVKNFKDKFFELAITDYINNNGNSIIVNKDGSFNQSFPIINTQELYLYLNNDAITFTLNAQDTIELAWDNKNIVNTFKVKSNKKIRNALLQTEWELYLKHRNAYNELQNDLYKKRDSYTPDQKYELINNQFNEVVKTLLKAEKTFPELKNQIPYQNLIVGKYYSYLSTLRGNNLLNKYNLKVKEDSTFKLEKRTIKASDGKVYTFTKYAILDGDPNVYKISSEEYLKNVPDYRSFMYNYLRFNDSAPITHYTKLVFSPSPIPNQTLKYYYIGRSSLASTLIEDWFITQCIVHSFNYDDFDKVEEVYNKFLPECKTDYFKDILLQSYHVAKTLKPGLTAPDFTLKNENGKDVSLADFKGKVVYIDFWGVYCGPCIYDIENYVPKLHEKYKDRDIVFLNICVDVKQDEWLKGLKKYKLDGINLIAEGWVKNPVCKAYNINGIPHYVLINKDGTIANNNASDPSGFGGKIIQELDNALKK